MTITKLDEYDIIIFDCDGVIIDINLLKCEAFGKAVQGYPVEIINEFVHYCKKTFGVSRYIKFKEFLSDFAREPFQEEKYRVLLKNYSNICKEIYDHAAITPDAKELLAELNRKIKIIYSFWK
ncbi:HAD family hydrolase [Metabacillus litoralis]|uniref:HAD family hydrolase n=1 Tax=Metabacillus litoralis TaxID=152268 RepID=UPI001E39EC6B|nr:HAD family hydrolase [Metabacillus litoralis]UHA57901.1 HAD family hydrolase [Metabacillus litoralis]